MRKLILKTVFCLLAISTSVLLTAQVKLIAPTETVEKGDLIEVDVVVEEFTDIVSMQFSMHYDAEVLEYKTTNNFTLPDLTINQIGEPDNTNIGLGNITLVWLGPDVVNGVDVDDDEAIFTIVFEVIGETGDISPITFDGTPTAMEVINANGEANYNFVDGEITVDMTNATEEIHTKDFIMYQNTPNPFTTNTNVQFNLKQSSDAVFTVYDNAGKTIFEQSGYFNEGMNTVQLDAKDFNGAGVYYCKLITEHSKATLPIILIK